jgi:hypothetical protein
MKRSLKKYNNGGKPLVNWFSRDKEYEYSNVTDKKGNILLDPKTKQPLTKEIKTVAVPDSILGGKGFKKTVTNEQSIKPSSYNTLPPNLINNTNNTYIETSNEKQDVYVDPKDKNSLKSRSYEIGKEITPKYEKRIYLKPHLKYQQRSFDSGTDSAILAGSDIGYQNKYKNAFGIASVNAELAALTQNKGEGEQHGIAMGFNPKITAGYNYSNKPGFEGSIRTNIGLDKREIEARQNFGVIGLRAAIGQNQSFLGDNWGASNENAPLYTKVGGTLLLNNAEKYYNKLNKAKAINNRTVTKESNDTTSELTPRFLAMGGTINNQAMKTNKYNNGGTIHIKPENKGKFNATKKATGKTTEELTHSKNPVTKKRAIFAQNAAKWKHAEGGEIENNLIKPKLPIKVTDPNDPRLRAYNDSNELYNYSNNQLKKAIKPDFNLSKEILNRRRQDIKNVKTLYPDTKFIKKGNITKYHYFDSNDRYDANAVDDLFHSTIKPIKSYVNQGKNFLETNINDVYKKPVQPVVYQKPQSQQPVVNAPVQASVVQPPVYTSKKQFYQGREFMDSTQLRPGFYHPEQITERMKDPNRKLAYGGRVLPKYADAGWLTKNKAGVGAGLGFAGDTTNLLFDNNVFGTRNKVTDSEGNELGEAQSDAGSQTQGALSGALKGASAGAALGPWGMAGGALIGGVAGFLTADTGAENKLNQIKRERDAQISFKNILGKGPIENNAIQTNSLALSAYGGYINKKYAAGGMKTLNQNHPEATEEVELGESAMLPNGMNLAFGGETHENGGLETNLPEGTRIFSDRVKSGKRTIASIAKPIQNKIEKLKENNSKAALNTVKLFENQLDNLFNEQEEIKQIEDMKQQRKYFAKGGLVKYSGEDGMPGVIEKPFMLRYNGQQDTRIPFHAPDMFSIPDAFQNTIQGRSGYIPAAGQHLKAQPNTNYQPRPMVGDVQNQMILNQNNRNELVKTLTSKNPSSPVIVDPTSTYTDNPGNLIPEDEPRFNKGDIGTAGALGTSLIGNLIQRSNLNRVAPPRTLVAPTFTAGRTPVKTDYSADLQAADNQFNAARRGVMMNSGNYSTQAGNLGQLRAEQLRNRSKILQNQNNANVALMNEYQKEQADAANKNAASNYTTDQANMENLYNYNLWKTGQTNAADANAFNTSGQMFNNMVTGQNQLDAAEMYRRMYAQKVQDDLLFKNKGAMGGTVRNYFAKGGTVYSQKLQNVLKEDTINNAAAMDAEYASYLNKEGQPTQNTFKSKITGLDYKVLPRSEKDLYAANLWKDTHNTAPTKKQVEATKKALDGKKTSSPGANLAKMMNDKFSVSNQEANLVNAVNADREDNMSYLPSEYENNKLKQGLNRQQVENLPKATGEAEYYDMSDFIPSKGALMGGAALAGLGFGYLKKQAMKELPNVLEAGIKMGTKASKHGLSDVAETTAERTARGISEWRDKTKAIPGLKEYYEKKAKNFTSPSTRVRDVEGSYTRSLNPAKQQSKLAAAKEQKLLPGATKTSIDLEDEGFALAFDRKQQMNKLNSKLNIAEGADKYTKPALKRLEKKLDDLEIPNFSMQKTRLKNQMKKAVENGDKATYNKTYKKFTDLLNKGKEEYLNSND